MVWDGVTFKAYTPDKSQYINLPVNFYASNIDGKDFVTDCEKCEYWSDKLTAKLPYKSIGFAIVANTCNIDDGMTECVFITIICDIYDTATEKYTHTRVHTFVIPKDTEMIVTS